MIERQENQLKLRRSREPKPTVELDSDSLEEAHIVDFLVPLKPVLARYAKTNPAERGTIYGIGLPSVNFHKQSFSEFLIVDGRSQLLHAVGEAFSALRGVQSKFSDYIAPAPGWNPCLHIEDGLCWELVEDVTWRAVDEADQLAVNTATRDNGADLSALGTGSVDAADHSDSERENDDPWDDDQPGSGPNRGRLRAARSDARIGPLKKTIETLFGLPAGSVALCDPDGRPLRSDATIGTLRGRWDEA